MYSIPLPLPTLTSLFEDEHQMPQRPSPLERYTTIIIYLNRIYTIAALNK